MRALDGLYACLSVCAGWNQELILGQDSLLIQHGHNMHVDTDCVYVCVHVLFMLFVHLNLGLTGSAEVYKYLPIIADRFTS